MKKLLLLASLIAVPFAQAATPVITSATATPAKAAATDPAKNLVTFAKLVRDHKADWFKYEEEFHKAKYELLAAEHKAAFDQKIKHVEQFANKPTSELYQATLDSMLALHKANMQKWADLCKSFEAKAKSIAERHTKDIANFEKTTLGKAPVEEPEEEEEEEITTVELVK